MEQRSEHQYMPLGGAATDPAYIPGLVPAPAAAPRPASADGSDADEADAGPVTAGDERAEPGADAAPGDDSDVDKAESSEDADEPGADGGPVCDVSDRQGSFLADRRGVRMRLGEEEADFRWDEISAVEYRTPRWSRRFEIVVYTPNHRWFTHDIEAPHRADLRAWGERLDAVLDAYFEE
ncbi:hypothetical protein [Streptomyces sp. NPDC048111]|uniref:hypothetical protein n=1 Tax=Streptomyces sp. NPDC048111 TaxID=3365500 RepID=UPI00371ABD30